jgi:hypothetical protein
MTHLTTILNIRGDSNAHITQERRNTLPAGYKLSLLNKMKLRLQDRVEHIERGGRKGPLTVIYRRAARAGLPRPS